MEALDDAIAIEIMDQAAGFIAVLVGNDQFCLAAGLHHHLGVFIYVAVRMTGNGDGLGPGGDVGGDSLHDNGGAEHSAVQNGTDGAVGGFPHLFEMVLVHPGSVGGDGGTFYRHTVLFSCLGRIKGYLVVGFIAVFQAQVVVFGFQVHIGADENVLDHFPKDTGHFVSVHLHQGSFHLNFGHELNSFPFSSCILLRALLLGVVKQTACQKNVLGTTGQVVLHRDQEILGDVLYHQFFTFLDDFPNIGQFQGIALVDLVVIAFIYKGQG